MLTLRNHAILAAPMMVCVLLAATSRALAEQNATGPAGDLKSQVAALVKQLDEGDFASQQKAAQELVRLGQPARDVLTKILKADEDLTEPQQSRIRDVIIDGGAIVRLEQSGKLEQEQIEILQNMRAVRLKRNDSYRAAEELRKNVTSEEMSDEFIALLVYSLVRQISDKSQDDWGFESYQVSQVFEAVLARPEVGEATGRAFGQWVRQCVLPACFPDKPKDGSGGGFDYQLVRIAQGLLARDCLDEKTYDALLRAMCRKMAGSGQGSYGSELQLSNETVVPLLYSRHCRSEHVGRIIEAIMSEALRQGGGGWSQGAVCLGYVVNCPKLTEPQARAIVQWLLPVRGQGFGLYGYFEAFVQLTGECFIKPDDTQQVMQAYVGGSTESMQSLMESRVRTWWEANRDKPILNSAALAQHRYVEVAITTAGQVEVRKIADVQLKRGVGQLLRDPANPAAYVYLCEARAPQLTTLLFGQTQAKLMPNSVDVQACRIGGNGSSMGANTFIPGEPQFVFQATVKGAEGDVPALRAAMLLDDKVSSVTAENLASADFWTRRIVECAAATTARAAKLKLPTGTISGPGGVISNPLNLQSYRSAAVEAEVRKLLASSEPAVVANAALLLARWGAEFDTASVRPLLNAKEEFVAEPAAEALALMGDSQAITQAIERAADPLQASISVKMLLQAAASPKLDAAARKTHAARIVRALLPAAEDDPSKPCLIYVTLAKAWTGEDFGYVLGADAANNNAALKGYHEWAAKVAEAK